MERFAVFLDLDSVRIGANMLGRMLEDITSRGDISYAKVYNYNARRHRDLTPMIEEMHMDSVPHIEGKRRVRVDMRQVIDAVRVASTDEYVTSILLMISEVDACYLIDELHALGKRVIVAGTSASTLSTMADELYLMDRALEVQSDDCMQVGSSSTRVIGKIDALFPYSDIDVRDIDAKMAEIDRRILEAIASTRSDRQYMEIFRSKKSS